jgi:hypothetical protein
MHYRFYKERTRKEAEKCFHINYSEKLVKSGEGNSHPNSKENNQDELKEIYTEKHNNQLA